MITSSLLFHISIMSIAVIMSFIQNDQYVQVSKGETTVQILAACTSSKAATFARLQCALNFQIFASVLSLQWEFPLALDGSTRLDTPYRDVRVRFVW